MTDSPVTQILLRLRHRTSGLLKICNDAWKQYPHMKDIARLLDPTSGLLRHTSRLPKILPQLRLTLLTMLGLWGVPYEQPRQVDAPRTTPTCYPGGRVYIRCRLTTPRWGVTCFYQCLRLCSCGTKPQHSKNHHFVMASSWEPQCHHDIIMRTPRITGKPKFSCSRAL